jgi:D-glycero-D-manno-heptose 1,7-bisphosphate phosphatase
MTVRRASNRFVLLDRDGTIIVERRYLSDPDGVELLPGAVEGLKRLQDLGLGLAVVTNQSGVGRGYFDVQRVHDVHIRLRELLAQRNIHLNGVFFCPHVPCDQCLCRKPRPGLAWRAADELHFDLQSAFVIGDKACDVELGRRVNAKSILVRTGYGSETATRGAAKPDFVAEDLRHAALHIENDLHRSERALTSLRRGPCRPETTPFHYNDPIGVAEETSGDDL